jgi:hypothetical protein
MDLLVQLELLMLMLMAHWLFMVELELLEMQILVELLE